MATLNVVILAAGKGTRMYSTRPKVLHALAGRALLQHVVDAARTLQATRIIVVYGHGGEQVREAFGETDLLFVRQEPQLGTGHAVQQALPLLDGDLTLVLYGDVPLTRPQTLQRAVTYTQALTLITVTLDNPTGYGRIVRSPSDQVQRIVEEKDASAQQKSIREINTGILCAPTAKLRGWLQGLRNDNAQREYYLTDVVSAAVLDGVTIETVQPDDEWEVVGVNSKDQLADLERVFQMETARALMCKGVTLADPARIDVRGVLECGQDVFIDVNCVFEGQVTLGKDVRIGANCMIRDAMIGEATEIAPYSHIEGARIAVGCRVGPYARLRPGSVLNAHAHVGNFVEMKNAELGEESKANHLSYLGDATIGRKVNIGAGTITCNYDGANKHRTIIEDEVFIGSDTQLVAPVTVGRGATIAAGTTVVRDAPPEQLTLSKKQQISVSGWQRPTKNKGN